MGFKKLWSKVARSLAIHRIVRLDYPFASQAASVKDGYATCEVLDRCCLRCFLGGILHGVNWPLLLVCLQGSLWGKFGGTGRDFERLFLVESPSLGRILGEMDGG